MGTAESRACSYFVSESKSCVGIVCDWRQKEKNCVRIALAESKCCVIAMACGGVKGS